MPDVGIEELPDAARRRPARNVREERLVHVLEGMVEDRNVVFLRLQRDGVEGSVAGIDSASREMSACLRRGLYARHAPPPLDKKRREVAAARTDLEQARADLERSRGEVEALQRERDSGSAADRDPYEGVSEHLMELVRRFDRDVERSRGRAELVASGIVAEARTEAARKRIEALAAEREARAQAERLLNEAQEEAANLRAEMAPLREWTLSQAQAIRDRMRMSLLELEAVMPSGSDEDPVIVVGEALEERKPPVP